MTVIELRSRPDCEFLERGTCAVVSSPTIILQLLEDRSDLRTTQLGALTLPVQVQYHVVLPPASDADGRFWALVRSLWRRLQSVPG